MGHEGGAEREGWEREAQRRSTKRRQRNRPNSGKQMAQHFVGKNDSTRVISGGAKHHVRDMFSFRIVSGLVWAS